MCMGGGGGGGGVITMPNTGAYDQMANAQIAAMQSVMDSSVKMKQGELNSALTAQQNQLTQLRDLQTQRANDVSAQAARLTQLIGTPPPEKSAEAPVVGRNRGTVTSKGKSALRIEKTAVTSSGQGSGLNIV